MSRLLAVGLGALSCVAVAIAQQPKVDSVVSSADSDPGVAINDFATIYGSGLSDALYFAPYPWPTVLGPTQVYVCQYATQGLNKDPSCLSLQILFASPGQVNVYIPNKIPGTFLSVMVGKTVDSMQGTKAYQIGMPIRPAFFAAGGDCFVNDTGPASLSCGIDPAKTVPPYAPRAAITDASGNLLSSSNLARIGTTYSAWMAGMGTVNAGSVGNMETFLSGWIGKIWFEHSADISYFGPAPGLVGLYQLNFSIDPGIFTQALGYPVPACGTYETEIQFELIYGGWNTSNPLIPTWVTPADLGCKD